MGPVSSGCGKQSLLIVAFCNLVIQEAPLPLACLFVTQSISAHIFSQVLVISPSLPLAGQSYFPRKSEMKYHLLGQRPSLEVSVTSVGVVLLRFLLGRTLVTLPVCDLIGGESRKQRLHGLSSCTCHFAPVTQSVTDKTGQKPQLGSLILPADC